MIKILKYIIFFYIINTIPSQEATFLKFCKDNQIVSFLTTITTIMTTLNVFLFIKYPSIEFKWLTEKNLPQITSHLFLLSGLGIEMINRYCFHDKYQKYKEKSPKFLTISQNNKDENLNISLEIWLLNTRRDKDTNIEKKNLEISMLLKNPLSDKTENETSPKAFAFPPNTEEQKLLLQNTEIQKEELKEEALKNEILKRIYNSQRQIKDNSIISKKTVIDIEYYKTEYIKIKPNCTFATFCAFATLNIIPQIINNELQNKKEKWDTNTIYNQDNTLNQEYKKAFSLIYYYYFIMYLMLTESNQKYADLHDNLRHYFKKHSNFILKGRKGEANFKIMHEEIEFAIKQNISN